jgi:transcriptional regulator with XRE-family HTH domain
VPARTPAHAALGRALRKLRTERGLSQEGLALEAGLDRTYIGGIERGERNPSYGSLLKVSEALGIPLSTMIKTAEEMDQADRS